MGAPTSAKITHAAAIAYFFWISTSYPAARWYAERMRCSSPAVAPTVTRLVGGICAAGAGAGMPGVERCAGGGGGGGATGVAVTRGRAAGRGRRGVGEGVCATAGVGTSQAVTRRSARQYRPTGAVSTPSAAGGGYTGGGYTGAS